METSKQWMKNNYLKNFKLNTYWKKEKRKTRLIDFVGDWVPKEFAIRHGTTIQYKIR
jgi:hypothetical protein